eukprot:38839_1
MATAFDVDKNLKEFVAELRDVGCSIKDIGAALRDQPEELKDKNWNAITEKKELTNFEAIYTLVSSVITYALEREQISYKPSQTYIKALTMKVITQLPQENDNPLLTQFDYVNNLHKILNEVHEEIDLTPIGATSSSVVNQAPESMVEPERQVLTKMKMHLETSEQQKVERIPMESDVDEPGEMDAISSDKNTSNDVKYRAKKFAKKSLVFALVNIKKTVVACVCFIVLLYFASSQLHEGIMQAQVAEEYAQTSEEMCLILSYERSDCRYKCGQDGPKKVIYCDSSEYLYTATASSKCGSVELYSDDFDVEESCRELPLTIGNEVPCYVLECDKQVFTMHGPSNYDDGTESIVAGTVMFGVFCLCLGILGFQINKSRAYESDD